MPIEDFIIYVYCLVDDFLKKTDKLRQRGPRPLLSDAEVITIEIVGEFLGYGNDKALFEYVKHHWYSWFPNLRSRSSFVRQSANLWVVKERLRLHLYQFVRSCQDIFLVDGFPIPICHPKRVHKKTPFRGQGDFGYCAAKQEKYFGFKGHLLTNQDGLIVSFTFTPANTDERDVLPEMAQNLNGHIIADKGFIRPELTQTLRNNGIHLHTPLRTNMKDLRPKSFLKMIMSKRRTIETVIGQLVERFSIQSIKAKDLWHLTIKTGRKILAHTMAFFITKSLAFDTIIA